MSRILPWKYFRKGSEEMSIVEVGKDSLGFPALLGHGQDKKTVIPVHADENGSLCVTTGKKQFIGSITLDLGTAREKELFQIPFTEITFNKINGEVIFYANEPIETGLVQNKMTIDKATNLIIDGERFYISNDSQVNGKVEIWLWR